MVVELGHGGTMHRMLILRINVNEVESVLRWWVEVGACAEPRGQTILYIVAHGTPTASKVLLHHLILLKLHSESIGLVVEPLGKANEFQHYFGILTNADCIESIRVEEKIEVTAGIDPADPVLL